MPHSTGGLRLEPRCPESLPDNPSLRCQKVPSGKVEGKREIHKERRKHVVPLADSSIREKSCKSAVIFPRKLTSNSAPGQRGFLLVLLPSRSVWGQNPADCGQLSVYSAVTVCESPVSASQEPLVNGPFHNRVSHMWEKEVPTWNGAW